MPMTVVVTTAAGDLGRAILERLLAHGMERSLLVATDRPASGLGSLDALGVVTIASDPEDPSSLAAVLDGARTLVYVPTDRPDARIAEATAVVGAATRAGIAWIVVVGTLASATSAAADAAEQRFPEEVVRASGM